MNNTKYITLGTIAGRLNLPQKYIRQQVKAGKVPHLVVDGRLRFQEKSVREALSELERPDNNSQYLKYQISQPC